VKAKRDMGFQRGEQMSCFGYLTSDPSQCGCAGCVPRRLSANHNPLRTYLSAKHLRSNGPSFACSQSFPFVIFTPIYHEKIITRSSYRFAKCERLNSLFSIILSTSFSSFPLYKIRTTASREMLKSANPKFISTKKTPPSPLLPPLLKEVKFREPVRYAYNNYLVVFFYKEDFSILPTRK